MGLLRLPRAWLPLGPARTRSLASGAGPARPHLQVDSLVFTKRLGVLSGCFSGHFLDIAMAVTNACVRPSARRRT